MENSSQFNSISVCCFPLSTDPLCQKQEIMHVKRRYVSGTDFDRLRWRKRPALPCLPRHPPLATLAAPSHPSGLAKHLHQSPYFTSLFGQCGVSLSWPPSSLPPFTRPWVSRKRYSNHNTRSVHVMCILHLKYIFVPVVYISNGEAQHFTVDNALAPFRRIYFKEYRFQPRTDRVFTFHEQDILRKISSRSCVIWIIEAEWNSYDPHDLAHVSCAGYVLC